MTSNIGQLAMKVSTDNAFNFNQMTIRIKQPTINQKLGIDR
jgi:hypothetical protein